MNVTPKNKKLDLGILQHLEQLLGLGLGWVISAYPPTVNIAPKMKVGFRHFVTFETTFRARVVISAYPPTMNVTPKHRKLDLGILQHLEQLLGLGLGWVISAYPQP